MIHSPYIAPQNSRWISPCTTSTELFDSTLNSYIYSENATLDYYLPLESKELLFSSEKLAYNLENTEGQNVVDIELQTNPINLDSVGNLFSIEMNTKLFAMQNKGTTDNMLHFLFERIENKLMNGEYDLCNKYFNSVDVNHYNIYVLIGLLTASYPWKSKLCSRPALFEKIKARTYTLYSSSEAEEILLGLN